MQILKITEINTLATYTESLINNLFKYYACVMEFSFIIDIKNMGTYVIFLYQVEQQRYI